MKLGDHEVEDSIKRDTEASDKLIKHVEVEEVKRKGPAVSWVWRGSYQGNTYCNTPKQINVESNNIQQKSEKGRNTFLEFV